MIFDLKLFEMVRQTLSRVSRLNLKLWVLGLSSRVLVMGPGSGVLGLEWTLNFLGPGSWSWVCLFFIGKLFGSANKHYR